MRRQKIWKQHLESMGGRTEITSVGIKINVVQPNTQGRLERGKIEEAMKRLKVGKAPGADGITAEMLKYVGGVVMKSLWICNLAWKEGDVPED